MRQGRLAHIVVMPCPVIAAVAVACFDAPQTVDGGAAQFDAQLDPPSKPPPSDAGEPGDADASGDAAYEAGCTYTDAGIAEDASTWTSIYADLFGPASLGQCGASSRGDSNGSTTCHHDGTGAGAQSSGFICGDTQESCYTGITSPSANYAGIQVVVPGDPCDSYLSEALRHDGGGSMPYYPEAVVFSDADMARVAAWIGSGAQNN
jgi:hypothetical protein